MPIEPWVFISYGRPEHQLAAAMSSHLWSAEVEAYNYLHKSVVERDFELNGLTYQAMQEIARLSIVILTPRSLRGDVMWFREAVLDEIVHMRNNPNTPIICLSTDKIMQQYGFVKPDQFIDLSACDSPAGVSATVVARLAPALLERCRSSFRTNQQLSPAAWSLVDSDMQATADTSALPPAGELIEAATGGVMVDDFISEELTAIQTGVYRWLLHLKLAEILDLVDQRHARSLMAAARANPQKDPRLLTESVSEKIYGPSETIASVADLIRGVVRFGDQLNLMDARRAYDIANRVTWVRTRQVLLCAVYRVARTMAEEELCEKIGRRLAGGPAGAQI